MRPHLWFRRGSYGLIALAVIHFLSNRHGLPISVDDPAGRELLRLMADYKINFFGIERSIDATIDGFILSWGFLLLCVAAINLSIVNRGTAVEPPASLKLINIVTWGLCAVVAVFLWSWPQALILGCITLAFVVSAWPQVSPSHAAPPATPRADPRIAIIGAGAAGLSAAWALKKKGYSNVTVFEKADRVGGKCVTFEYEGHAIDLAAHEMLAGYTDVMRIADDVGAPTQGWQDVLVYDRASQRFLDIMSASTTGGYSTLQVAGASLRYTWMLLTRYRNFARPGTGLAEAPDELFQPVGSWLNAMRLDALQVIVTFVMQVQGYGRMDEVPAAYFVKFQGLRNWVSNVLHNIGIMHGWPRVFSRGFQDLWDRVAANLDIRFNSQIVSIERQLKPGAAVTGVNISLLGQEAEQFDALILATPLDRPTLQGLGLDLSEQESRLSAQVRYHTFVTTACRVEGLPAGVVGTIPLPGMLEYTGYIKVYKDCDVAVFFSVAPTPTPDLDDIYRRICATVAAIPPGQGTQPRVVERVRQQAWPYFPHPETTAMAAGYFVELQALQGVRQTFYAGSLLEMETVGNTVANALYLIEQQFPPRQ